MIVKARTEYTKELFVELARFNAVNPKSKIIAYIILELLTFGIVAYGFYSAITEGEAFELAIVFAFVFPLICPVIILILPIFVAKENNGLVGGVNTYEFTEEDIKVDSAQQEALAQTKMNYNSLKCVRETKKAFYLYISKRQIVIVRKSDIYEGSVSNLQAIFRNNMPEGEFIAYKKPLKISAAE